MKRELLIYFTALSLLYGFYSIFGNSDSKASKRLLFESKDIERILPFFIVFIFGYLSIFAIVKAKGISIAIAILFLFIPYLQEKSKASKSYKSIRSAWPEMIDQLVMGIQSGVSLTEALLAMRTRGPIQLTPFIEIFSNAILEGNNFEEAIGKMKNVCNLAEADQIAETLILAKKLGSKDVGIVLRTLSQFLREDLAIRLEIEAKHGWIKNSAVLAAIAPWILLLILSTQSATVSAYSNAVGLTILLAGVLLTVIAFFWMEKVGSLPVRSRVLGTRILAAKTL